MGNGFDIHMMGGRVEDQYFIQKVKLGHGTFGTVWRAVDKKTQQPRAVKEIEKFNNARMGINRDQIMTEIAIMQACTHPNIIRLYGNYEDSRKIYLVLEYCEGGDFGDKMKQVTAAGVNETEVVGWMRQVFLAISALHEKNICHRDIKPDNFMASGPNSITIKLADFGMATFMNEPLLTEKCGTPAYMAPEIHKLPTGSRGYDFKVDVWAAGLVLYQFLHRNQHPFIKNQRLDMGALLDGQLEGAGIQALIGDAFGPILAPSFSKCAHDMCKLMMERDPQKRISSKDALRRPWLMQSIALAAADAARAPDSGIAPREASGGSQQAHQQSDAELARRNAQLQCELDDKNAKLKEAEVREFVLTEIVCQETPNLDMTLRPAEPQRGVLQPGCKCCYWSSSKGCWIPAVVQKFHATDGTYSLDVREHAPVELISPRPDVTAKEADRKSVV